MNLGFAGTFLVFAVGMFVLAATYKKFQEGQAVKADAELIKTLREAEVQDRADEHYASVTQTDDAHDAAVQRRQDEHEFELQRRRQESDKHSAQMRKLYPDDYSKPSQRSRLGGLNIGMDRNTSAWGLAGIGMSRLFGSHEEVITSVDLRTADPDEVGRQIAESVRKLQTTLGYRTPPNIAELLRRQAEAERETHPDPWHQPTHTTPAPTPEPTETVTTELPSTEGADPDPSVTYPFLDETPTDTVTPSPVDGEEVGATEDSSPMPAPAEEPEALLKDGD